MKSFQSAFNSFIQKLFSGCFLFSTKPNPILILDRFYYNNSNNIYAHHLFLLDVKTKLLKELHVPKVTHSNIMGFKIIGSCHGLLCIAHYSLHQNSTLFIWNPATKQTRTIIEQQQESLLLLPPDCLIGFYFNNHNEKSHDFYVVRLHSFEETKSDSLGKIYSIRAEKYSLSDGLWREIKGCDQNLILKGNLFWTENCVTVEETLFWVAIEVSEKVSHEMIISFNSCNNVISKIEMPFSSKDCAEVYKKLAVYKDSLSLVICSESKNMEQWLDLWVLSDEYEGVECWNKVQTIGMFSRLERPVGVWKNEILMATNKMIHGVGGIVALLPEDDIGDEFSYNILNYEESFIPLDYVEESDYIESEGFLLI
ncbi:F-box protein At3g07870-like [Cicer arietinum]|uniref:F-box/kelch-repeat protein At3g23880-like n=1 Tax=Cicer arietinum TaxID=3827 RepID=A0A1S2YFX9_CICAR|nr:F-box/kelch-repeat protein At3g23880-like [Cicer arietinum]